MEAYSTNVSPVSMSAERGGCCVQEKACAFLQALLTRAGVRGTVGGGRTGEAA